VKIRERKTKDSEGGKTPDIFSEMKDLTGETWLKKALEKK
jgi:hypothetical protein